MTTLITVSCNKGGVSKSTTATQMADLLAEEGKDVLFVDLDGNCLGTKFYLGPSVWHKTPWTMTDVLSKGVSPDKVLLPTAANPRHKGSISVLPAGVDQEKHFDLEKNRQNLQNFFNKLKTSSKFDVILIDGPPTKSNLTPALWNVTDRVLCVGSLHMDSNLGIEFVLASLKGHRAKFGTAPPLSAVVLSHVHSTGNHYRNYSESNRDSERELHKICLDHGLRLVGPVPKSSWVEKQTRQCRTIFDMPRAPKKLKHSVRQTLEHAALLCRVLP